MNFPTDEQRIINLLSRGYVIPTEIFEQDALQKALQAKFLVDDKPVKLIKQYTMQYESILSATVDSRFEYGVDEIIF